MAWSITSRQSRGYGAAWDKLRKRILERDGYLCRCPECTATGRPTPAQAVDHIVPKAKGGSDDPANLRAVSNACHVKLSLQQQGKTYRPKVRIGIDGYPIVGR